MASPLLTVLTDFGSTDPRTATLSAHLLRHAPLEARLLPLSHAVRHFDLAHAAYLLGAAYPEFPVGSVHTVVVAPDVAAPGQWLAVRHAGHFFLLPDNGLLTLLLPTDTRPASAGAGTSEAPDKAYPEVYRLPALDPGAPARTLLGAAAGHLAWGRPLNELGEPATDYVRLHQPQVQLGDDHLRGHVIHVDHFGNLITTITADLLIALAAERPVRVRVGGEETYGLQPTYTAVPPGELAAVLNARGRLCVGLSRANAAQELGVGVDAVVEVVFGD